ncbi:hypothetical protein Peur_015195 [Populus x canadensis]
MGTMGTQRASHTDLTGKALLRGWFSGPFVGATLLTRAKIQRDPPGVGAWMATTIIESIKKQIVTAHVSIISSLTPKKRKIQRFISRKEQSLREVAYLNRGLHLH